MDSVDCLQLNWLPHSQLLCNTYHKSKTVSVLNSPYRLATHNGETLDNRNNICRATNHTGLALFGTLGWFYRGGVS